jgi:phosphoglycerate dehydrogenase-like enzyme
MAPFNVILTAEFAAAAAGGVSPAFGLGPLTVDPLVAVAVDDKSSARIDPGSITRADGILVMDQKVDDELLEHAPGLRIVARYGVGTNSVDLDACTRRGVLVTITPEGVVRPVASSALTLILCLAHRLGEKQELLRSGRWDDRSGCIGVGLTGRTIGILGLGRTGRELARLAEPFGARIIAHDPYADAQAAGTGVRLVSAAEVFRESDFVVVMAALTPQTHHLVSAQRLAAMKPSAYLINVARGPIVDQAALTDALRRRAIAGAGLDVFEQEPPPVGDPLLSLSNVIVTPHSLCWTDECFTGNGGSAAQAIADIARGLIPDHVANPAVLDHPRVQNLRAKAEA